VAEQLAGNTTATAVLTAFHHYRLNSVPDNSLQPNQALTVTSTATRTRTIAKERNGTRAYEKPGKIALFFILNPTYCYKVAVIYY